MVVAKSLTDRQFEEHGNRCNDNFPTHNYINNNTRSTRTTNSNTHTNDSNSEAVVTTVKTATTTIMKIKTIINQRITDNENKNHYKAKNYTHTKYACARYILNYVRLVFHT